MFMKRVTIKKVSKNRPLYDFLVIAGGKGVFMCLNLMNFNYLKLDNKIATIFIKNVT